MLWTAGSIYPCGPDHQAVEAAVPPNMALQRPNFPGGARNKFGGPISFKSVSGLELGL